MTTASNSPLISTLPRAGQLSLEPIELRTSYSQTSLTSRWVHFVHGNGRGNASQCPTFLVENLHVWSQVGGPRPDVFVFCMLNLINSVAIYTRTDRVGFLRGMFVCVPVYIRAILLLKIWQNRFFALWRWTLVVSINAIFVHDHAGHLSRHR